MGSRPTGAIFGASGTLAYSPFDHWPAAIVSLFGLLSLTLNRTTKQATFIGFVGGWGYLAVASTGCMSASPSLGYANGNQYRPRHLASSIFITLHHAIRRFISPPVP